MRSVCYSVAMSLDGFIAGPQGEADWIEMGSGAEAAAFFNAFYARFDTALMGRKTYEFVKGPMEGMTTYVFSRTLSPSDCKGVTVVSDDGMEKVRELRAGDGKDIWLFGGGELFGSLAAAGLVDTLDLGVMPVMLGGGVPVMSGTHGRVKLELIEMEKSPLGGVSMRYRVVPRPKARSRKKRR